MPECYGYAKKSEQHAKGGGILRAVVHIPNFCIHIGTVGNIDADHRAYQYRSIGNHTHCSQHPSILLSVVEIYRKS